MVFVGRRKAGVPSRRTRVLSNLCAGKRMRWKDVHFLLLFSIYIRQFDRVRFTAPGLMMPSTDYEAMRAEGCAFQRRQRDSHDSTCQAETRNGDQESKLLALDTRWIKSSNEHWSRCIAEWPHELRRKSLPISRHSINHQFIDLSVI